MNGGQCSVYHRSFSIWGFLSFFFLFCLMNAMAQPKWDCPQAIYDFGVLENESTLETVFAISNLGTEQLHLESISTDCGCTAALSDSEWIAPGETISLKASFHVSGHPGRKETSIAVRTNDPRQKDLRLQMFCHFKPAVFLKESSISLGTFRDDERQVRTGEIIVYSGSDEASFNRPKVDLSQAPGIAIVAIEQAIPGDKSRWSIKVTNDKPLPAGNYVGALKINTDLPEARPLNCHVLAKVIGKIDVRPDFIALDRAKADEVNPLYYLQVTAGYVKQFKIREVQAPDPGIDTEIVDKGSYRLIALRNIPRTCAMNGKEIILETDVTGMERIAVPLKIRGCAEETK